MLNRRSYTRAVWVALCLALALVAVSLLSCQSSVEKARNEMEPVYRSAKLLREQLKAGVTLAEFNRLRGNFATELSIIKDRMQAKPGTARLLQPYFSAYGSALDAYSLVGDVWEYNSAKDAYIGPEPEFFPKRAVSLNEQKNRLFAQAEHMTRIIRWIELESTKKAQEALRQRSEHLNAHCGSDLEWHFDCIVENADGKLTAAEKLLMPR